MAEDFKTLKGCVKQAYPTIEGVKLYDDNAYAKLPGNKYLDLTDGTTLHDWGLGVGTARMAAVPYNGQPDDVKKKIDGARDCHSKFGPGSP